MNGTIAYKNENGVELQLPIAPEGHVWEIKYYEEDFMLDEALELHLNTLDGNRVDVEAVIAENRWTEPVEADYQYSANEILERVAYRATHPVFPEAFYGIYEAV